MKTFAAALVGLCAAAAGVAAQRQAAPRSAADVAAYDVMGFESAGTIGRERDLYLKFIANAGGGAGESARGLAIRLKALRALGRLENGDLLYALANFTRDPRLGETGHLATLLTLRANVPAEGPDEGMTRLMTALIPTAPPAILGQFPYSRVDQFAAAESRLAEMLEDAKAPRATAARAIEALARRNRRLAQLSGDTLALLEKGARWELPSMNKPADEEIARNSFAALMAAGAVDGELIELALGEESAQLRRLGAFALFAAGATVSDAERTRLVRVALEDRDYTVRYDALRAWVRRETTAQGCGPIAAALGDESQHVSLAAIDALGDRCVSGEEAEGLTQRLVAELRTPPDVGSWHREAHALVAAARRVPERAALALPAFRTHNVWQVRMYAARAGEVLKDVFTLDKLAYDANDNVREATLVPLQRLTGAEESEAALIAALGRPDYQLVRTAAIAVKNRTSNRYVVGAVVAALERITAEKKDTSRDTRLALMERLREAGMAHVGVFEKLLTDFDPRIAGEAATALRALTGVQRGTSPRPFGPTDVPSQQQMDEQLAARLELDSGRYFEIRFDKQTAPLADARISRLVRAKYYDGLTFHRVVPNFVIQGGSPGANEYAGDARFMRDELSARPHSRGTVGLSTRGHHTGDAQIFINLADNRTLDFDYTVIGEVNPAHMPVVDTIQEGARIVRMRLVPAGR